jgi:hypothetical protein
MSCFGIKISNTLEVKRLVMLDGPAGALMGLVSDTHAVFDPVGVGGWGLWWWWWWWWWCAC